MARPHKLPTTRQSATRTDDEAWAQTDDVTSHRLPPATGPRTSEPETAPVNEPSGRRWSLVTLLLLVLASLPFLIPHLNAVLTKPAPPAPLAENSAPPPANALRAAWRDIHRPPEALPDQRRTLAPVTSVLEDMATPARSAAPAQQRDTSADPPPSTAALLAEKMATPTRSAAPESANQPSSTPPAESVASAATDPIRPPTSPPNETDGNASEPQAPAIGSEAADANRDADRVSREEANDGPEIASENRPTSARTLDVEPRSKSSRESRSFDAAAFDDREIERLPRARASPDPITSALTRAQHFGKQPRARLRPARRSVTSMARPDTPDAAAPQGMSLFQGLGRVTP